MKQTNQNETYFMRLRRDIAMNKSVYVMVIPVLLYYFIFHYKPMYGAVIAFKEFTPAREYGEARGLDSSSLKVFSTAFTLAEP